MADLPKSVLVELLKNEKAGGVIRSFDPLLGAKNQDCSCKKYSIGVKMPYPGNKPLPRIRKVNNLRKK
jgi:small nuclear ribonucleoprotein (snRNP)-like protein